MKKSGALLFMMFVGLFYALRGAALEGPATPDAVTEPEQFPIATRFELPRNYGYFIGDEIPLTLTIEAHQGVVIDLVNLPRQGEQHGLFEIRDLSITTTTKAQQTVHRATYTLQYFGAAPLTVQFEPLEILYAHPKENAQRPQRVSHYKSLFTQPVVVNISRLGPYRSTQALDPKGPLPDRRTTLIWLPSLLGLAFLGTSVFGWAQEWKRAQQGCRLKALSSASALTQALLALRDTKNNLSVLDGGADSSYVYVGRILREYLHHTFDVPAFALTTRELASTLEDTPHIAELLQLLERCDALKYQLMQDATTDTQQLWDEAISVLEQFQQGEAA